MYGKVTLKFYQHAANAFMQKWVVKTNSWERASSINHPGKEKDPHSRMRKKGSSAVNKYINPTDSRGHQLLVAILLLCFVRLLTSLDHGSQYRCKLTSWLQDALDIILYKLLIFNPLFSWDEWMFVPCGENLADVIRVFLCTMDRSLWSSTISFRWCFLLYRGR